MRCLRDKVYVQGLIAVAVLAVVGVNAGLGGELQ
jgi:hypothetical protein